LYAFLLSLGVIYFILKTVKSKETFFNLFMMVFVPPIILVASYFILPAMNFWYPAPWLIALISAGVTLLVSFVAADDYKSGIDVDKVAQLSAFVGLLAIGLVSFYVLSSTPLTRAGAFRDLIGTVKEKKIKDFQGGTQIRIVSKESALVQAQRAISQGEYARLGTVYRVIPIMPQSRKLMENCIGFSLWIIKALGFGVSPMNMHLVMLKFRLEGLEGLNALLLTPRPGKDSR